MVLGGTTGEGTPYRIVLSRVVAPRAIPTPSHLPASRQPAYATPKEAITIDSAINMRSIFFFISDSSLEHSELRVPPNENSGFLVFAVKNLLLLIYIDDRNQKKFTQKYNLGNN